MKTAYELAMERLGGGRTYTEEQKAQLAEVDSVCDAKTAEIKLHAEAALKKAAQDPARLSAIKDELARDLQRIEERREADKDKIRQVS